MIRCLIIDDYQEHIDALVNTLNMYGYEARGVSKATEALQIAAEWRPHLIICDGLMEGMRAWRIGQHILSHNENYHPYMVVLTGFTSELQQRLCEETGWDEYVEKPIELKQLLGWGQEARKRAEGKQPEAQKFLFRDKESPADKAAKKFYKKNQKKKPA